MSGQRPLVVVFSKIPGLASAVRSKIKGINITDVSLPENGDLPQQSRQTLQSADVLLADPGPVAECRLMQDMPNLLWMQSTWAGVDSMMRRLDPKKDLPQYLLTKDSGHFGQLMGEYVIGFIISHQRQFLQMAEDQKLQLWRQEKHDHYKPLPDLTLGIMGVGDIGKAVAKFAKTFGMTVNGLVRNIPDPESRSPHIDQFLKIGQLKDFLESCDYLCSVLPSTPQTSGLLSNDILAYCKDKKPVLINVGRGDLVDESSLIKALDSGWISHAVLDVFQCEPLPTTSALWSHPGVTITPHVSAISMPTDVSDLFAKNYDHFIRKENLLYCVDWQAGY